VKERVLITGGAGFIGRHVTNALLLRGYEVVVYDALLEQVHFGSDAAATLPNEAELVREDIRNAAAVRRALRGVDAVVHLAAEVGVGQSMYAIERYVGVNDCGTAVLCEELARSSVRRIVVASSMSIYGEGLYRTEGGEIVEAVARPSAPGTSWDPVDEKGRPLIPIPTPETKRPALASVYALTKYVQERLVLMLAAAYGMEACALRLFNVFGPGQALSNPYTGVLAIFASRLLNGQRPLVFEDGLQRRDFVHVSDVARAFVAAIEEPAARGVFNIGSGRSYAVREVAQRLAAAMGREHLTPEVIGKARVGDVRHCFADIGLATGKLGYRPVRALEDGLEELTEWVKTQRAIDRVNEARLELERRGLVA
jgi:dTDP-L-rhamnose 4-epimerase